MTVPRKRKVRTIVVEIREFLFNFNAIDCKNNLFACRRLLFMQVDRYDGQLIWIAGEAQYDLGNYLGGGAAGVVYEASNLKPSSPLGCRSDHTNKNVAVKILNPVGFKLMPNGALQRCIVARKGSPPVPEAPMGRENVWWVVHPNSRAVIAAHQDPRTGQLRELPLPRCIEIWGWDPLNEGNLSDEDDKLSSGISSSNCSNNSCDNNSAPLRGHCHVGGRTGGRGGRDQRALRPIGMGDGGPGSGPGYTTPTRMGTGIGTLPSSSLSPGGGLHSRSNHSKDSLSDEALEKLAKSGDAVLVGGFWVTLPRVPPKYVKWLRARQGIYKEIANMSHLGAHRNVVGLYEVLEYVQDSKSTLFLVLELVTGGELFDRIQIGRGTSEATAKRYFRQLIDGVGYCHANGVCHRDLKPENLLLSDAGGGAVLKIADFGLSAAFAIAANGAAEEKTEGHGTPISMRRLRSVVGSPHYVAPEVSTESVAGYDGPKADVWSAGVILYAILAGNLPFGKELSHCPRYIQFKKWIAEHEVVCLRGGAGVKITSASGIDPNNSSPPLPPSETARKAAIALDSLSWFFPSHFSILARTLLVTMLHPEASQRPMMEVVSQHAWVDTGAQGAAAVEGVTDDVDSVGKSVSEMDLDKTPSPTNRAHFFSDSPSHDNNGSSMH